MVTFRNNKNHSRRRYRNNDRNFRRNGDNSKFKSDFSTNVNFQRKTPGRNNHNASKLIEKYTDLAREALAHEDKILSENYFQHADHFTRILNEQESFKRSKFSNESSEIIKPDTQENLSSKIKEESVEKDVVNKKEEIEDKVTIVK